MGTSSILDGNRFDTGSLDALDPSSRALVERRMNTLGTSYRLFYRRPVQIVRGLGTRLYDAEGREYLDAYNNVASVGHCNPAVVAAVTEQLNTLATHSRYLQDGIVEYSERLLQTFPEPLNRVMYTNSGSEANDLALRVARHHTGGTGIVVTSEAYHGTTASCAEVSPSDGGEGLPGHVIAVDPPNPYRHEGDTSVVDAFAARVTRAFETLRERGHQPAALLRGHHLLVGRRVPRRRCTAGRLRRGTRGRRARDRRRGAARIRAGRHAVLGIRARQRRSRPGHPR